MSVVAQFSGTGSTIAKLKLTDYTTITSPAEGDIGWDYTNHQVMFYSGTAWASLQFLKLTDYTTVVSPVEGDIAWDYQLHQPRFYNGTSWITTPITTAPANPVGSIGTLAGYWTALPGQVQNVSYTSVATNTTPTTFTLSAIIQTPEQRRERLDSYGKYVQRAKTIKIPDEVWNAVAGSLYPKPSDTMVISGITWQVSKDTDIQYSNGLYRLAVNYFEPQFQIDDTVSFLNPSVSGSSSTGDRQVAFITTASNIPAAIEPIQQEVQADHFGAITSPEYFDVFLSRDISTANNPSIVKAGALIQDQNNVQYEVMEVNSRERLDLETHLVCVKKL